LNASELFCRITIDPDQHDTKDELRTTLLHELLHLVHAEFDLAFLAAIKALNGSPAVQVLEHVVDFACERLVAHLMTIIAPRLRKVAEVN
jgi:hypothetical protein